MDYLAEIASSADVAEALGRLTSHPDFPSHMEEAHIAKLRESFPIFWRSELRGCLKSFTRLQSDSA
jgi:hypothetical protein